MSDAFDRDQWTERAIPTVPAQRTPQPAEDWDTACARFPRQRPDDDQH
ncbi:hypothetical protein ABZ383_26405 [Streptomyces sp. NPDC005900]